MRVLHELRASLPAANNEAPRAVGGSLGDDISSLPTTMVELVLREAGWRAVSLGSGHPMETLCAAVRDMQPRLFWLSISYINDRDAFLSQYRKLHEATKECGVALVVGGRALDDQIRLQMEYASHCDNLRHLVSFAETLYPIAHNQVPLRNGAGNR
jgi:methanogenic corrinoid protein MtbC1